MKQIEILQLLAKDKNDIKENIKRLLVVLTKTNGYDVNSKFEYFFQDGYKNIKLLHILFYKINCNIKDQQKIYAYRKKQIQYLFMIINKDDNFNSHVLLKIFNYINDPSCPIQFGIEFNEKIEKIKLYFSNINRTKNSENIINLAKELMKLLNIKNKSEASVLLGEGIDSIGIDFHSNGKVNLKIYTFFHSKFEYNKIEKTVKNQFKKYKENQNYLEIVFNEIAKFDYSRWGFLYRISNKGIIKSVKFWYKIADAIFAPLKLNENRSLKISYITCDKNGIGYYLREDNINLSNHDYLFKEITEKITETDFTGYTIQYPPMSTWKQIDNKLIYAWQNIGSDDKLGLYVHVPFCEERCAFCRYYSKKLFKKSNLELFLDNFKKEIFLYKPYLKNRKFSTIYIGGGTPTIFDKFQLKKLFLIIDKNFSFMKNAQKCIEATPQTLNSEKLRIIKDFGINRLTLGIQTLSPNVLRNVNRYLPRAREQVRKIIFEARKINIDKINTDIMVGLPGETIRSFSKMLNEIIRFAPDMIHIHPFYPTKYTQFMKEGCRLSEADMDLRNEMANLAKDILFSAGYRNIKYDAFGKDEKSRNIQLSDAIENFSSYLGLGPGAVSHIRNSLRYVNFNSFNLYTSYLSKKQVPIMKGIALSEKDEMIYYVTACLRYGEVSKIDFSELFKKDLREVFMNEFEYLKARGLIEEGEDKFFTKFNNIGEYLVFSKYFYSEDTINYFKKNNFTKKSKLYKNDTKYLLL